MFDINSILTNREVGIGAKYFSELQATRDEIAINNQIEVERTKQVGSLRNQLDVAQTKITALQYQVEHQEPSFWYKRFVASLGIGVFYGLDSKKFEPGVGYTYFIVFVSFFKKA